LGDDPSKSGRLCLDPNIIDSLKEYRGISKLKKEAMNVLVKMIHEKDLEHLRN
jgi:Ca2+-binding EF-hand superfamily protein